MSKTIESVATGNRSSVCATDQILPFFLAKPHCAGRRVLNISCGEGHGGVLFQSWGAKEVIGIDPSDEMISRAKRNFNGQGILFFQYDISDAELLRERLGVFDLIVWSDPEYSAEYSDHEIAGLKSLLSDDGGFILTISGDEYDASGGVFWTSLQEQSSFKQHFESEFFGKSVSFYGFGWGVDVMSEALENVTSNSVCDEIWGNWIAARNERQILRDQVIIERAKSAKLEHEIRDIREQDALKTAEIATLKALATALREQKAPTVKSKTQKSKWRRKMARLSGKG